MAPKQASESAALIAKEVKTGQGIERLLWTAAARSMPHYS